GRLHEHRERCICAERDVDGVAIQRRVERQRIGAGRLLRLTADCDDGEPEESFHAGAWSKAGARGGARTERRAARRCAARVRNCATTQSTGQTVRSNWPLTSLSISY